MLSSAQIEIFNRDGVIALPGFFSRTEVDRWREQVLQHFGRPDGGDAWRVALGSTITRNFRLDPDPTPDAHAGLARIYASLYPACQWAGHNELIVRAGDDPAEWRGAHGPHLDIPIYAPIKTLANYVIYLSTVGPRGGAFMYWPGSHRIAWQYFREFPADYLARGAHTYQQAFLRILERVPSQPVEVLGEAGDLLIWHSLTLHSASTNKHSGERVAVFGRWGVQSDLVYRHDFSTDIWQDWCFGADGKLMTPPMHAGDSLSVRH